MIENNENITLTEYLDTSHPEIIKSINKEKYVLDYGEFDLFHEITLNSETVGFIALENDDSNESWIINECYIIPDRRGSNLFFKNYIDIINSTEKRIFIRKPNRNLINVLLNNSLAFKMQNNIVISYVDFIVELTDAFKNSKIKRHYKKIKNENFSFTANLFDFNFSSVLFFDENHIYSKNYDTLCICEARKYDMKRYSLRKKLKKIQLKYINKTFEIIHDNLIDSFDYFKDIDEDLSNSNKTRTKFLTENPGMKDKNLDKIRPTRDFIFNCPYCGKITQKSAIHCHTCGLNLEKTLMINQDGDKIVPAEDYDDFENHKNSTEDDFDKTRSFSDSENWLGKALSKIAKATAGLAYVSKKLNKKSPESLNMIDYDYLGLDRDKYNSKNDKDLNIEKSMYALVKYANEHPTIWMFDYYLKSIDDKAFDLIIKKKYITKVMPDKFDELFKDYSVEELMRESEIWHDPDTTKNDMIKYFKKSSDFSWIVSEKGFDYLKSHPFLDFFTNNLMNFNIYEFKLFTDKYQNELTLEQIGDKYINAKLTKALSNQELDLYLDYVDYYYNLNLSKKDYETALIYLIQRIVYENNIWHLKEEHFPFDEVFSLRTDYLIFKIIKLGYDFDLKKIFEEAYNSLKVEEVKFAYSENYEIVRRLMNGENIYDISGEMLDWAKEQGLFKSFY